VAPGRRRGAGRHGNNRKIWINLRDAFPHPYTIDDAREFITSLRHRTPETTFAISVTGKRPAASASCCATTWSA